ncbi:MAG: hypothetical protein KAT58_12245, partial [candidate division Zixibacteria bacterium]|nr:hypothetical protein [candidate division Zixibacteria bacterium]
MCSGTASSPVGSGLRASSPIYLREFEGVGFEPSQDLIISAKSLDLLVGRSGDFRINSANVFPSGDIEKALIQTVKRFPSQIELAMYLTGDNNSQINKAIAPELIIGVAGKGGEMQTRRELENLTDLLGKTRTMIGVAKGTQELGIQVVAARDEFRQDKNQFIPISELSLDRPLAYYLSENSRQELFQGKTAENITNDEIRDRIVKSQELKKASHTYFNSIDGTQREVEFLADFPLQVDMFSSARSLHPMKNYILTALSPTNNKFQGGQYFGLSHVHYGYTDQEIEQSPHLVQARKVDERFVELITPFDAKQLMSSRSNFNLMSKGQLNTRMAFVGVTALDPANYELIGSTYFDGVELSKNDADFRLFNAIAPRVEATQDPGVIREYWQLTRKYSPSKLPPYVASSPVSSEGSSSPITGSYQRLALSTPSPVGDLTNNVGGSVLLRKQNVMQSRGQDVGLSTRRNSDQQGHVLNFDDMKIATPTVPQATSPRSPPSVSTQTQKIDFSPLLTVTPVQTFTPPVTSSPVMPITITPSMTSM